MRARFYRGGLPPLEAGAGRELGADDGLLDLGIGCEALDDWPIVAGLRPDDVIPEAGDDTGAVCTCSVTVPRVCTCCEIFAKLLTWPRGTPKPAELFRTTTLFPETVVSPVPRFTINVLVPLAGALGAAKPAGAFTTRG